MALDESTTTQLEYLIQQLLESKLTPEERTRLESLLAAHDYLEAQFLHEIETESALRNLDRSFDVSERVMHRIRTHLADQENKRIAGAGSRRWRNTLSGIGHHPWRVTAALVAATALLIAGTWALTRPSPTTMTLQEGITDSASTQVLSAPGRPASLNASGHVSLGRNTNATIACRDGTHMELGLEADMTLIKAPGQALEESRHARLTSGRLDIKLPPQEPAAPFLIETPHATATILSGDTEIFVSAKVTQIRVRTGTARIRRSSDHTELTLAPGQYAVVRDDLDLAPRQVLPLRVLFDDNIDPAAYWTSEAGAHAIVRPESRTGTSCLRITPQQGRVTLAGLALPIREHPQPGEFRFVTFAWRKDGGGRIALQFDHADEPQDRHKQGRLFGYRFDAGEGPPVDGAALRTDGKTPVAWWTLTRDLWEDFGDLTVTGITFVCPDGDSAQFDGLYLGRSPADFSENVPTSAPFMR